MAASAPWAEPLRPPANTAWSAVAVILPLIPGEEQEQKKGERGRTSSCLLADGAERPSSNSSSTQPDAALAPWAEPLRPSANTAWSAVAVTLPLIPGEEQEQKK